MLCNERKLEVNMLLRKMLKAFPFPTLIQRHSQWRVTAVFVLTTTNNSTVVLNGQVRGCRAGSVFNWNWLKLGVFNILPIGLHTEHSIL